MIIIDEVLGAGGVLKCIILYQSETKWSWPFIFVRDTLYFGQQQKMWKSVRQQSHDTGFIEDNDKVNLLDIYFYIYFNTALSYWYVLFTILSKAHSVILAYEMCYLN